MKNYHPSKFVRAGCNWKVRYRTKDDAEQAARAMIDRTVLTFGDHAIHTFWCIQHQAFHVGNRWKKEESK